MSDPSGPIQVAAIARLRGDTTLQGLLGNPANPPGAVYDAMGVPPNTAFPYLVVFPITKRRGAALALDYDAMDVLLQVSGFTQRGQAGGFGALRPIMEQVYTLLQRQALVLTGTSATNFFLLFDTGQELPEPDGLTQQSWQRWQLMNAG